MVHWGVLAALLWAAPGADDAAKEKDYQAQVSIDPNDYAVGGAGKLSVTIRPKAPWGLKVTTPFEATLTGSPGVELGKAKLTSKDFVDPKATDKVVVAPFTAKQAGAQSISTALNFFLCTDQVCQRYKETIVTPLTVH